MAKIRIMDANLANKIAAGEVVERPSSVVKECVENAIDAGATKVDVILEEAGLQTIKIIDNGSGMDKTDALNAFERHATSKLLDERDLFRINTLGFRGEALPSIASVSDLTLVTKTEEEEGTMVHIRGGKLVEQKATAANQGTEITINNLFFNTPARLKYLKTLNTELGYTVDYINKIAISHPHIAMRLVNDGRVLLQTNGNNNVLNIIASIYGMEVAKKMKQATYKDSLMDIKVYFSEPEVYRTSRNYINLIVNNRVVKNKDMIKAISDGYEGYLPVSRFPIVAIEITVDPLLIDVNVHPAKLEIRFSNNDHVKSIITNLIRKKLKEMQFIPKVTVKDDFKPRFESKEVQQEFDFKSSYDNQEKTVKKDVEPTEDIEAKDDLSNQHAQLQENEDRIKTIFEQKSDVYQKQDNSIERQQPELEVNEENPETNYDELKEELPKLYYIGQLSGTYLLAQNDKGLYLIDQHAAEERINYEYYLKKFSQDNNEVYELLVPLTFEFSLNEAMKIEERLHFFEPLNIKIEKFGLKSFIVTEVPNWFKRNNDKENVEFIFDYILKKKAVTNKIMFNALAETLSCKRSIKANHYINNKEVQALLDKLVQCDRPYRCPHGRPVVVHISFSEIEYMFKRTV